jgi:hypothetical protein
VSDELDVLLSVTARLQAGGIFYMVTGSMAANFYATPRMTRDIDLVVELSDADIDRVVGLFHLDRVYLGHWADRLGLTALYREVHS